MSREEEDGDALETNFVEEEVWECQRRDGINWVPSIAERGRFSDRYGRFKYNSLSDISGLERSPPNNNNGNENQSEFIQVGDWMYGKSFAHLESGLAKGITMPQQASTLFRWRRWIRRREILKSSSEIMAGWLGAKSTGGLWKSRFFILSGNNISTSALTPNSCAHFDLDDDEPPSSNDEEEDNDEDAVLTGERTKLPLPPISTSPQQHPMDTAATEFLEPHQEPARLFYLRKGFEDPRNTFPRSFDFSDLKRLSKKHIKRVRLPSRGVNRVDDTISESTPGRFALKFSSGRKLVFVAPSLESRERWMSAFQSVLEDDGPKKQNRLAAALKRSQHTLQMFGLRRQSTNNPSSATSLVGFNSPVLGPTTPTETSMSSIVELVRDPASGLLNVRLCETGNGLVVQTIFETCREATSMQLPTNLFVGDVVVAVQGESLLHCAKGTTLALFKEIVFKSPKVVSLQVRRPLAPLSSSATAATTAAAMTMSASPLKRRFYINNNNNNNNNSQVKSRSLVLSDESEGEDALSSSSVALKKPFPFERVLSTSSTEGPPNVLPKLKNQEVPENLQGLQSASVRAATKRLLDDAPIVNSQGVVMTYSQLRTLVAQHFKVGSLFETVEWRVYFRDFLDCWVCDGIQYNTGGLDMTDFTPVILRRVGGE